MTISARLCYYDHAFPLQTQCDGKSRRPVCGQAGWKATNDGLHHRPGATVLFRQLFGGQITFPRTGTHADWQGLALKANCRRTARIILNGFSLTDCILRPREEYASLTEYQFIPF